MVAPVIVLITYVAYFIGVTSLLGPEQIMQAQDAHVYMVAERLFGGVGAKLILIAVILAVMGTANGIILGYIRLPYAVALRGDKMIPFAGKLAKINEKRSMPVNSAIFCYAVTLFWTVGHIVTVKFGLLPNSDISEIAIVMSYLFYLVLYYKVFQMYRRGEVQGKFHGVFVPALAAVGSLFILSGGLQSKLFLCYAAVCILTVLAAFVYYGKHCRTLQNP